MNIQSRTAKMLKYPALATLAAVVGTLTSCNKAAPTETVPAEDKPAVTPQPFSGMVAPEVTIPPKPAYTPQQPSGVILAVPESKPTVIPQATMGSVVPCPQQPLPEQPES